MAAEELKKAYKIFQRGNVGIDYSYETAFSEGYLAGQQYAQQVSREVAEKVFIEKRDSLHKFFNHFSDMSPLEATQQEELECNWERWIMGDL